MEGFLDRLADSKHAKNLVLKGGVLLAAYDLRRPTRDVDLQAQTMTNGMAAVLAVVK
ncbi:MAG: nucleotidyl transferase AbiEii/AbiGii toxin family protein, partial [Myxococcaceae bacterium]